jgi:hypothetical protein
LISPVAVQVPVARTFPLLSVWVNSAAASTAFGLTETGAASV